MRAAENSDWSLSRKGASRKVASRNKGARSASEMQSHAGLTTLVHGGAQRVVKPAIAYS